ncbi:MAG TPA: hypothetical protein VKZ63_22055 [Kofleriaceae bacterium]|nr:hypothetical protein [Kofleriaceae bacterium]
MLRLLLGLIKGLAIGGAVGYGAYTLDLGGGFHWVTYGLVGALVGLLVGRPFWSHLLDKSSTTWTAVLKGIFGFGVGAGLYALVAKAWGGFDLSLMEETRRVQDWQFVLGGAIGALYGAFVEVDDAPRPKAAAEAEAARKG